MSTDTYTRSEVAVIEKNLKFWQAYEHEGWTVVSFTGQQQARFGLDKGGVYVKYVVIDMNAVDFVLGVDADVLDHFFA